MLGGYDEGCTRVHELSPVHRGLLRREKTRAAGFSSPVFLKYVSEGRSNLSEETAGQVASAMGLANYEQDYFCEMVRFDHAKTDEEKKSIFNKMLAIADIHKVRVLEGDSFRYFDSWKNPVLRELAPAMPGAKPLALAKTACACQSLPPGNHCRRSL